MITSDLNVILKDIDQTVYFDNIYFIQISSWKEFLKKELNAEFGLIKFHKTAWKPDIYNAIHQQVDPGRCRIIFSKEIDFIYAQIEAIALLEQEPFSYKLFDYCEQRLHHKTQEREFLYKCISNIHKKLDAGREKNNLCRDILYYNIEKYIISEMFLWSQPECASTIYYNRILNNLKQSYENQMKYWIDDNIKKSITAYTNLLAKEVQSEYKKL